jgi:uncharacterized glyoxalase superfamily protein PhnB
MVQQTATAVGTMYPCLFYQDAPAAMEWLARAFGFETVLAVPGETEGTIMHAEMRLGSGVIMLGTARPDAGMQSPRDLPAVNQTLYVYVEDVAGHYRRAKAAGARITRDLEDKDYGGSGYSAADPEGQQWSFGSYAPQV